MFLLFHSMWLVAVLFSQSTVSTEYDIQTSIRVINRYTEDVNVYIHGNDDDQAGCDLDVTAGRGNPDECHCLWGREDYTFCAYKIVNESAAAVNYDEDSTHWVDIDLSDDDAPEVAVKDMGAYTGGEMSGGAYTGAGDTTGEQRQNPNVKIGDVFSGGDTEESRRVRPLNIFRKRRHHRHKKSNTKGAVCPKREGEELMCRDAKTLGSCYHMSYTCHILVSGACECMANKM